MAMDKQFSMMIGAALATTTLSIATVLGIIVLAEFKANDLGGYVVNNVSDTTVNDSIDAFIAGLAVFGTFMVIITLTLVAKIIIGLLRGTSSE